MNDPSRAMQLVERYFDRALSESEVIELERRLADDADVCDAFAAAAQEDQRLRDFFRGEHCRSRADEILRTVIATAATQRASPQTQHGPAVRSAQNSRKRALGWCAAAALLLMSGAAIYWKWNPIRQSGPPAHELIAGAIAVNGVQTAHIPQGVGVEVTSSTHAIIRLVDGSLAELAPASRAVFQGPVGSFRQVIALDKGTGRFQVEKGGREFRVETPVGSITALGTEFTVEVRQPEQADVPDTDAAMNRGLVVAVLAGQVEVSYGDQTYPLALGDDRIYFAEAKAETAEPDVIGKVVDVRSEKHGPTTMTIETRKTSAQAQRHFTIQLTGESRLSWINVPVDRQFPSLGYMASVWRNADASDEASAVQFMVPEESAPPPDVRGRVADVSPDGQSFTLELPRRSKQEPPQIRTIALGPETNVTYFFVRFDAERPTVGQQATVWLSRGSHELATEIHLAGDKRGAYRPDVAGRVMEVSADGKEIELLESGKKGNGLRRVFRIAPGAKVLQEGSSSLPGIGDHASIWLEPGSADVAIGIRIGESAIASPRKRK